MLIDGQKYDIFWSLAGAGAGALPAAGALWHAGVAGSLPSLLGPTLPHPLVERGL